MGSTISAILGEDDSSQVENMPCDEETKNISSSEESIAKEANNQSNEETTELNTSSPDTNSSLQSAASLDPEDSTDAEPALTEAMKKHDISDTSDDTDHSFELIGEEDITAQERSTPLRISSALKTLVKMGWDGSALETSSSRVLEIMVPNDGNDDSRTRFGNTIQLNDTKSQKVSPIPSETHRIKDEFREIVLTHILNFATNKLDDMIIELPLAYLDTKFIINIIHNLAARTRYIELEVYEQHLFDKILQIFEDRPDLVITAFVPLHMNKIHLNRITGQGKRCHSVEARAKRFNDALLEGKELPATMEELMREYGPLAYDESSYFDETLIVQFLLEIYTLVKNDSLHSTYFVRSVERREKNILRDRVISINKKNYNNNEDTLEVVLYKLILQHMEGCKYELLLCDYGTYFSIFKDYNKCRRQECGDLCKNEDCLYENNSDSENDDEDSESQDDESDCSDYDTDYESDDGENDANVENFESKQEIDDSEDEETIDEETVDSSETLSAEETDDELSTSDESENFDYNASGENKNKCVEIRPHMYIQQNLNSNVLNNQSITTSSVHLREQPQAEKFEVKIVYVTINDIFSEDTPKFIQGIIAYDIEKSKELPYLVCHGVHNNAIVYSCHTNNSYAWLLHTCFDHYFAPSTKEVDKMSLKINCYYDMKENDLFRQIEMYNNELSTKHWTVLKTGNIAGTKVFDVKMDQKSVNFILKSKMSLYAGIDTVTFNIIF